MSTNSPDHGTGDANLDRRGFLGRAGRLVAVGLGLAVLPAQAALADQSAKARELTAGGKTAAPTVGSNCCRTTSCSCPPGYNFKYMCTNTSGGAKCCYCSTNDRGTCFGAPPCAG